MIPLETRLDDVGIEAAPMLWRRASSTPIF